MNTRKLRVAVLGTGGIIRDAHLPALMANDRVEVVALGHARFESLQALADEFGISDIYTDFDALAAAPNIDAVVNGLPNYLHASTTIAMLRHGKHVLCEKPMAMNVAEAKAMQAAATAGVKLMIAFPWRSNPDYQWLRDKIAAGAVGRVYKIRADAVTPSGGPDPSNWRTQPEISGGGVMFDIGSHSLDTISFLFGDQVRPTRVFARMDPPPQSGAIDDLAEAVIEYDNGMTGIVEAGWNHPLPKKLHGGVEIFGTLGSATTFPTELWTRRGDQWHVESPGYEADRSIIIDNMFAEQVTQFVDCIANYTSPLCDGKQGVRDMELVEAIYRSARTGQAMALT